MGPLSRWYGIIQILYNSITYKYRLVCLPFDLNASCLMYLETAGLDGSNFEWDFKVARVTLSIDRWRPLNSVGTRLAQSLVQRSGGHPVFFRHMDRFTCQHVVGISVWTHLYGKYSACAYSGYQAFPPPPSSEGLGTRVAGRNAPCPPLKNVPLYQEKIYQILRSD